jgi:hypothetical protein
MLPTEDKTGLFTRDNNLVYTGIHLRRMFNEKGQLLYFTSSEEIKEGDWYLLGNTPRQSTGNLGKPDSKWLKIIATTDTELGYGDEVGGWYPLPQIPQSFIEEYCKQGGIDKVELEYEENVVDSKFNVHSNENENIIKSELKLTPNNEVIVCLIEKKIFTHDDITHALAYGYQARRAGISHHEALLNYKEVNNL